MAGVQDDRIVRNRDVKTPPVPHHWSSPLVSGQTEGSGEEGEENEDKIDYIL